ncbi:MAG: flagellar biosynthesis protein FlgA [Bdellovibrionales bacterium CG10_big_fil_rev_8_21_14_0_10_45_34]|nr:MAG: flagellar biosynthesis protein FlgA [Bdellovibrionales bacterium CG10_big_fil_rev_8_21_14_0_10_45_34]
MINTKLKEPFAKVLLAAGVAVAPPPDAVKLNEQTTISDGIRVKDLANVRGVRANQLIGYGLVVGLGGTGDGKMEFTSKSLARMFESLGLKLDSKEVVSKNVAAVLITAELPPFARAGNTLDITVNSIGDASSLRGGTLVQTPLRAANQQVFAVAQGSVIVGETSKGSKPHLTVGRISGGAIIERDLDTDFASKKMFRLTLHNPDFTTAARLVKTVNADLGGQYATAKDSSTIDMVVPFQYEGNAVEFLALIENLKLHPDQKAKVVVNQRTGTIVMGKHVRISEVALTHEGLSLTVGGGDKKKKDGKSQNVFLLEPEANVGELVNALNGLGITPKDLIVILQSIKSAGALHGELDIL